MEFGQYGFQTNWKVHRTRTLFPSLQPVSWTQWRPSVCQHTVMVYAMNMASSPNDLKTATRCSDFTDDVIWYQLR